MNRIELANTFDTFGTIAALTAIVVVMTIFVLHLAFGQSIVVY